MNYRLYQSADFEPLYAIEEICFPVPDRFSRSYLRQLIERSNSATWIAESDGRPCGFAIVDWKRGPGIAAYIQTLEVLPEYRSRGIGGALMRNLERSAQEAGAEQISLHVAADNSAAIRLYEVHGFSIGGSAKNYYGRGRNALIYSKHLTGASMTQ